MKARVALLAALLAAAVLGPATAAPRPPPPRCRPPPPPPPPPPSYIVSVAHQAGGLQPYPRALQNRAISVAVGSGSNNVTYSFTVDTGSGLFELGCQNAQAQANCGGKPLTNTYVLNQAQAVTSAATCATTGINCLASMAGQPPQCLYSQGLTGGAGYNGNKGVFARDTVYVRNVLSSKPLTFPAIFACSLGTWKCAENATSCIANNQACPANNSPALQTFLNGGCRGSNAGVEAGFTFSLGGKPSAVALPEQVFQAGLIQKRVLGICWQPPQKDANCSNALAANSAVVLGPALPTGLSLSGLQSAPLYNVSFGQTNGSGASTHTFRTWVNTTTVPAPNGGTPKTFSWPPKATIATQPSVLWDTGAYGQATVPQNVFNAFMEYYNASRPQVIASSGFAITACNASILCGANQPTGPGADYACQKITLPANAPSSMRTAARAALAALYPPTIDIGLQGGAVAKLPTAYVMEDCTAQSGFTASSGVVACSAIRSLTPVPPGGFWLAGPWFNSRFVQFDLSTPPGVIRFSNTISSCAFPRQ